MDLTPPAGGDRPQKRPNRQSQQSLRPRMAFGHPVSGPRRPTHCKPTSAGPFRVRLPPKARRWESFRSRYENEGATEASTMKLIEGDSLADGLKSEPRPSGTGFPDGAS